MKKTKNFLLLLFIFLAACLPYLSCRYNPDKIYILSDAREDSLLAFAEEDHFSDDQWEQRGLIPSPREVENKMNASLQDAIVEIMEQDDLTENRVKGILVKRLKENLGNLDTEEREFITDVFFELAEVLKVDIKSEL